MANMQFTAQTAKNHNFSKIACFYNKRPLVFRPVISPGFVIASEAIYFPLTKSYWR
jgi:hypothetical protein